MIERGEGHLLEADVDALVNAVNTVGVMGKGIALQFEKAFPRSFERYAAACGAGRVAIGRMLVVETETVRPAFIVNFQRRSTGACHRGSPSSRQARST
jgi:O-acetyl-ADP-ribose deacetylase (regulator of RNase III)